MLCSPSITGMGNTFKNIFIRILQYNKGVKMKRKRKKENMNEEKGKQWEKNRFLTSVLLSIEQLPSYSFTSVFNAF